MGFRWADLGFGLCSSVANYCSSGSLFPVFSHSLLPHTWVWSAFRHPWQTMLLPRLVGGESPEMHSTLLLVRKRLRRRVLPPPKLSSLYSASSLLYLQDKLSGVAFLVDTGASCSVLPHVSTAEPSGPCLAATSGRAIPSWGTRLVPLQFGSTSFTWEFLLPGED